MFDDVVIVGGSLAGLRAAQALRRGGFAGGLTMVGAEGLAPYQRPPLSKEFLAGKWDRSRLSLPPGDGIDIAQILGVAAVGLDPRRREVQLETGERLAYDGLVIATGALPRLPGPWTRVAGVHTLRTYEDALALREAFARTPRVVVVGAGFIGLEVAATARERGLEVTVIEARGTPLCDALGPAMGSLLIEEHREHGVRFVLGVPVQELIGTGAVMTGVRLGDGRVIPADVVVVGIGVTPATGWLQESGIPLEDGVLCDSTCAVEGWPNIVAAGDVARWWHPRYGRRLRVEHWDNAILQGMHAAQRLLQGPGCEPYEPVPSFWSDQYDTKYQFIGVSTEADSVRIMEGSVAERCCVAGYHRRDRLIGALAVNCPHRTAHYGELLSRREALGEPSIVS